jgi:hypothetical protein
MFIRLNPFEWVNLGAIARAEFTPEAGKTPPKLAVQYTGGARHEFIGRDAEAMASILESVQAAELKDPNAPPEIITAGAGGIITP